jgi:ferritin-like metal-binding protein YciE
MEIATIAEKSNNSEVIQVDLKPTLVDLMSKEADLLTTRSEVEKLKHDVEVNLDKVQTQIQFLTSMVTEDSRESVARTMRRRAQVKAAPVVSPANSTAITDDTTVVESYELRSKLPSLAGLDMLEAAAAIYRHLGATELHYTSIGKCLYRWGYSSNRKKARSVERMCKSINKRINEAISMGSKRWRRNAEEEGRYFFLG